MQPLRRVVLGVMCAVLSLPYAAAFAENLDAELDREWGHKRTETVTIEKPKARYGGRLKLLQEARDAQIASCQKKAGGDAYCRKYAEEQFRREKRALNERIEAEKAANPGKDDAREDDEKGFDADDDRNKNRMKQ
ncbi:MAG: hypothetical protein HYX63_14190 [Gammaproteobacteria bacterium]|nr:hypothetical protein [Gammaproteobacteria bacterium]